VSVYMLLIFLFSTSLVPLAVCCLYLRIVVGRFEVEQVWGCGIKVDPADLDVVQVLDIGHIYLSIRVLYQIALKELGKILITFVT
jgi:hypothetical protein